MMLLLEGSVLGKEHTIVDNLARLSLGSFVDCFIHRETKASNFILSLPNSLWS